MSRRARQELRMWKQRTRRPQHEIAKALEISAPYLSQILHGERVPGLTVMLRIETLVARGDQAGASRLGKAFLKRAPNSPYARRVRSLIGETAAAP